ncbi:hypothetical protein CARUB_v10018476mg [Capsella rubella]|uniref:Uncharacterized protein n=1 Tax=Capsella rubella TaxID=81985 RepID=R0HIY0_9BRAS|nr:hypothetical protein CARUB_v10018476mg [Capsella rubella]
MGTCHIPSYADEFGEDDVPCTDPQIELGLREMADEPLLYHSAGTDCDVHVVEPTGDSRRARSAEVNAARAGKKVSRSASGSAPPSSGSPLNAPRGDVREAPIRAAAEGVDHSSYSYSVRDQMLCTNGAACAGLTSKIRGDFPQLPSVGSLLGQELYEDWACEQVKNISRTNHLVGFYEERSRAAMREVNLTRASLETVKRSDQSHLRNLGSEKGKSGMLSEQLKETKGMLTSKTARLRRSREQGIAAERRKVGEEIVEYRSRIDMLSRHVVGLRAQKDPLLILSQVKGTQKCLQKLITEGISPLDKMGKLTADRAKWQSIADGIAVPAILEGDLDFFPEFISDSSRMPPPAERQGAEEADGAEGGGGDLD